MKTKSAPKAPSHQAIATRRQMVRDNLAIITKTIRKLRAALAEAGDSDDRDGIEELISDAEDRAEELEDVLDLLSGGNLPAHLFGDED